MKRYCVIKEKIDIDGSRIYTKYYFIFKFFAIRKAKKIAKEINKKFHNQDRVFIMKGNQYFNPDMKYTEYFGVSWTTC